tara:strand:- start:655 stop:837 length:183 start_codon:yes stop_codon:yes gene_type:complete
MRVLLLLVFFSCQNQKEIISIELSNDIVPISKELAFNDKRQDTLLLGYNYPGVGDCMWCD